jgi:hypothetical protein
LLPAVSKGADTELKTEIYHQLKANAPIYKNQAQREAVLNYCGAEQPREEVAFLLPLASAAVGWVIEQAVTFATNETNAQIQKYSKAYEASDNEDTVAGPAGCAPEPRC